MALYYIKLTELIDRVKEAGFNPEEIAVKFNDSHFPAFINHGSHSIKQTMSFESVWPDRFGQNGLRAEELDTALLIRNQAKNEKYTEPERN